MDGMLCHDLVAKRWINPDIQASPNPSNKRHLPPAERRWPSSVSPFSNSDPGCPPVAVGDSVVAWERSVLRAFAWTVACRLSSPVPSFVELAREISDRAGNWFRVQNERRTVVPRLRCFSKRAVSPQAAPTSIVERA